MLSLVYNLISKAHIMLMAVEFEHIELSHGICPFRGISMFLINWSGLV